jgi:Protein kinase domain
MVTENRRASECYAAPEVLEDGKFNKKSDIWSLGCVLYEICAGGRPFNNGWQVTNYGKSSRDTTTLPDLFSDDWGQYQRGQKLNQTIQSMIQRDSTTRPSTAEICASMDSLMYWRSNLFRPTSTVFFETSSLLGTEAPIWKGTEPTFEQVIPNRSYRDHPQMIQRRTSIIEARAGFLGPHDMTTAWTKFYVAWTMFLISDPSPQPWTYLNLARNDISEFKSDDPGQNRAELVIQSTFAYFSSRYNDISATECSTLVIRELERQKLLGITIDIEHLLNMKLNLERYRSRTVLAGSLTAVEEMVRSLGPEHPRTIMGQIQLASRYCAMDEFDPAKRIVLQISHAAERIWGTSHGQYLTAVEILGSCFLRDSATVLTGVKLLTDVLSRRAKLFGPTHFASKRTAENIRQGVQMIERDHPIEGHQLLLEANHLLRTYELL